MNPNAFWKYQLCFYGKKIHYISDKPWNLSNFRRKAVLRLKFLFTSANKFLRTKFAKHNQFQARKDRYSYPNNICGLYHITGTYIKQTCTLREQTERNTYLKNLLSMAAKIISIRTGIQLRYMRYWTRKKICAGERLASVYPMQQIELVLRIEFVDILDVR